jgi:pseudouridine-5'-phosphate glycosidase
MSGLRVRPEVADALAAGHPVVALESTIISHGMPYPTNVAMATEVEQIVRSHGAVPATIAVLDGVVHIGLEPAQLEVLASHPDVHKATTRDLPWLLATGRHGATTVAATMRLASLAGIRVFATGGIGGVHRGAASSFDISADLTEMSTTPVAVISAGIKSILDIGLTLERLETLGVPVVVNGSDEFPSFYSRGSGLAAPRRLNGAAEIAAFLDAAWRTLGLTTGVSIANPIPVDDEIPADHIHDVIDEALAELDARGIGGQDVTPFLLGRIVEKTDGRSLTANVALVRNNAMLAAQIAVAYAELDQARHGPPADPVSS